jgi:glycine betaine/proline transport system substrate-binding protein
MGGEAMHVGLLCRQVALGLGLVLAAACGTDQPDSPYGDTSLRPGAGTQVVAARATWESGYFDSEVVASLLRELGYSVTSPGEHEVGATVFYPLLATGVVDYWASGWFPLHEPLLQTALPRQGIVGDYVERVGYVVEAGALQGYLIDLKTAEAEGIDTMADLKDPRLAALFDIDGDGKADLIGCDEGWGCAEAVDRHVTGFGWGGTIEHIQGDYSTLFSTVVTTRVRAGDPVLYYTWTPNYTVAQLVPGRDVRWLEVPDAPGTETRVASVRGCASDPCEMGFVPNDIRVVANSDFLDDNPAAARLFELVRIPEQDIFEENRRLFATGFTQQAVGEAARRWINENRDTVDSWLTQAREAAR